MKEQLLLASCCLVSVLAQAQSTPVALDTAVSTRSHLPAMYTPFGNNLYFTAQNLLNPSNGYELWQYTGAGIPTMVHDLNPGPQPGALSINGTAMAVVNGTLYFSGDNGSTGLELYQYNGTGTPTLAKEINTGTTASNVKDLVSVGNKVYFSAWLSGAGGTELYQYDPATNVLDAYDIQTGSASGDPQGLTVMNGMIYFSGTPDMGGTELLVFNPATNTFAMAANIEPGNMGSDPRSLVAIGNNLYFTARTTANGREVYRFDGTTATRISDLNPGAGDGMDFSSTPYRTVIGGYNGDVYFIGTDGIIGQQMYKYNPTTGAVTPIHTISNATTGFPAEGYIEYNGKLYFAADDGTHGQEIWVHDGTTTAMLTDLVPGNTGASYSDPIVWNGNLYFTANNGTGPTMYKLGGPNSIQSILLDGTVSVFPNPASGDCKLSLDLKSSVSCSVALYDATGKMMHQNAITTYTPGNTSITLPTASLPAAIYFYSLLDDKGRTIASGRIAKQ